MSDWDKPSNAKLCRQVRAVFRTAEADSIFKSGVTGVSRRLMENLAGFKGLGVQNSELSYIALLASSGAAVDELLVAGEDIINAFGGKPEAIIYPVRRLNKLDDIKSCHAFALEAIEQIESAGSEAEVAKIREELYQKFQNPRQYVAPIAAAAVVEEKKAPAERAV